MDIYFDYKNVPFRPSTITLGNFDGVHRGHQKIIRSTLAVAHKSGSRSLAVTFHPHPRQLIAKDLSLLTPLSTKISLLAQTGLDAVLVQPFTRAFASMSPENFVEGVLGKSLGCTNVVVGYDYCFGKGGSGNYQLFEAMGAKMGFSTEVVSAVKWNGEIISSTSIRSYLAKGDLNMTTCFLNRNYFLEGKVEYGAGRGTKLGFPTANIYPKKFSALPAYGVYLVWVQTMAGENHWGVANIGCHPTFLSSDISLEVHLLDFVGNLYGRRIKVGFVTQLRDEHYYTSPSELSLQVQKDVEHAKALLRKPSVLKLQRI